MAALQHTVNIPAHIVQMLAHASPAQLATLDPTGILTHTIQTNMAAPPPPPEFPMIIAHTGYGDAQHQPGAAGAQVDQHPRPDGKSRISAPAMNAMNIIPKTTRPVNSWMAFRSYYSPMFANFQQKEISGILTYLWEADPFKAKWSVLAKAYSMVRDTLGRHKTRLDVFLALAAPFVGMLPPHEYMAKLGWQMETDEDGDQSIVRGFEPDWKNFETSVLNAGHTVYDVIQYSYEHGLIPEDGGGFLLQRTINAQSVIAVTQAMMTGAVAQVHFGPVQAPQASQVAEAVIETPTPTPTEAAQEGNVQPQEAAEFDDNQGMVIDNVPTEVNDANAAPFVSEDEFMAIDRNNDELAQILQAENAATDGRKAISIPGWDNEEKFQQAGFEYPFFTSLYFLLTELFGDRRWGRVRCLVSVASP